MREKFDCTGFQTKFRSELDRRPVVDKDAAMSTLDAVPGKLKEFGLDNARRRQVIEGFRQGIWDGNPRKSSEVVIVMDSIMETDLSHPKRG